MAESKDDDYDLAGLDAIASVESPEKLAIQRKVGKWAAMNMNPVALLKHAADRLAEWPASLAVIIAEAKRIQINVAIVRSEDASQQERTEAEIAIRNCKISVQLCLAERGLEPESPVASSDAASSHTRLDANTDKGILTSRKLRVECLKTSLAESTKKRKAMRRTEGLVVKPEDVLKKFALKITGPHAQDADRIESDSDDEKTIAEDGQGILRVKKRAKTCLLAEQQILMPSQPGTSMPIIDVAEAALLEPFSPAQLRHVRRYFSLINEFPTPAKKMPIIEFFESCGFAEQELASVQQSLSGFYNHEFKEIRQDVSAVLNVMQTLLSIVAQVRQNIPCDEEMLQKAETEAYVLQLLQTDKVLKFGTKVSDEICSRLDLPNIENLHELAAVTGKYTTQQREELLKHVQAIINMKKLAKELADTRKGGDRKNDVPPATGEPGGTNSQHHQAPSMGSMAAKGGAKATAKATEARAKARTDPSLAGGTPAQKWETSAPTSRARMGATTERVECEFTKYLAKHFAFMLGIIHYFPYVEGASYDDIDFEQWCAESTLFRDSCAEAAAAIQCAAVEGISNGGRFLHGITSFAIRRAATLRKLIEQDETASRVAREHGMHRKAAPASSGGPSIQGEVPSSLEPEAEVESARGPATDQAICTAATEKEFKEAAGRSTVHQQELLAEHNAKHPDSKVDEGWRRKLETTPSATANGDMPDGHNDSRAGAHSYKNTRVGPDGNLRTGVGASRQRAATPKASTESKKAKVPRARVRREYIVQTAEGDIGLLYHHDNKRRYQAQTVYHEPRPRKRSRGSATPSVLQSGIHHPEERRQTTTPTARLKKVGSKQAFPTKEKEAGRDTGRQGTDQSRGRPGSFRLQGLFSSKSSKTGPMLHTTDGSESDRQQDNQTSGAANASMHTGAGYVAGAADSNRHHGGPAKATQANVRHESANQDRRHLADMLKQRRVNIAELDAGEIILNTWRNFQLRQMRLANVTPDAVVRHGDVHDNVSVLHTSGQNRKNGKSDNDISKHFAKQGGCTDSTSSSKLARATDIYDRRSGRSKADVAGITRTIVLDDATTELELGPASRRESDTNKGTASSTSRLRELDGRLQPRAPDECSMEREVDVRNGDSRCTADGLKQVPEGSLLTDGPIQQPTTADSTAVLKGRDGHPHHIPRDGCSSGHDSGSSSIEKLPGLHDSDRDRCHSSDQIYPSDGRQKEKVLSAGNADARSATRPPDTEPTVLPRGRAQPRRRAKQNTSGSIRVHAQTGCVQQPEPWVGATRMRAVCERLEHTYCKLLHTPVLGPPSKRSRRNEATVIEPTQTTMGISSTTQETNKQFPTGGERERTGSDTYHTILAGGDDKHGTEDATSNASDPGVQQQATDTTSKLSTARSKNCRLVERQAMESVSWAEFVREAQQQRGVSKVLAEDPRRVYKTRADSTRGQHLDRSYSILLVYLKAHQRVSMLTVTDVELCNIAAEHGHTQTAKTTLLSGLRTILRKAYGTVERLVVDKELAKQAIAVATTGKHGAPKYTTAVDLMPLWKRARDDVNTALELPIASSRRERLLRDVSIVLLKHDLVCRADDQFKLDVRSQEYFRVYSEAGVLLIGDPDECIDRMGDGYVEVNFKDPKDPLKNGIWSNTVTLRPLRPGMLLSLQHCDPVFPNADAVSNLDSLRVLSMYIKTLKARGRFRDIQQGRTFTSPTQQNILTGAPRTIGAERLSSICADYLAACDTKLEAARNDETAKEETRLAGHFMRGQAASTAFDLARAGASWEDTEGMDRARHTAHSFFKHYHRQTLKRLLVAFDTHPHKTQLRFEEAARL